MLEIIEISRALCWNYPPRKILRFWVDTSENLCYDRIVEKFGEIHENGRRLMMTSLILDELRRNGVRRLERQINNLFWEEVHRYTPIASRIIHRLLVLGK